VVDTMPWEHVTDEAIAAAAPALCGGGSGGGDAGLLLPAAPRSGGKRAGRSAAWYEERGAAPPAPLPARRVPVREFAVWREGTLRGGASSPVLSFRLAAGPGASPRALAHALGEALGTCAHLSSLRREALGGLSVERAWPLDALLPALQAGQGQMRAARRQRR
jgi:tRNA U55 pseudouridine synthase TruB